MRIHSVEEFPAQPDRFEAFIPVGDEGESQRRGLASDESAFPVEVVRAPRGARRRMGANPLVSVVAGQRRSAKGRVDVVLESTGATRAVVRAAEEMADRLPRGAIVMGVERLGVVRRGLHFRKVLVEFVSDDEPWDAEVWLPAVRVHRPARKGCTSVYSVTQSAVSEHSADYSFAGMGGGGKVTFTCDFTRVSRAGSRCKEGVVPARAEVRFGTTLMGGQPVAYGAKITIHHVRPQGYAYRDIPREFEMCGREEGKVPAQERIYRDLAGATGGVDDAETDIFSIAREVAGTVSVGVTFGKSPVSLSVSCTRTSAVQTAIQTTLMPGARYLGYAPRAGTPLEKCWTVLAA